jgi:hypothetical protein
MKLSGQVETQITWHLGRAAALDVQIAGLCGLSLSPIRVRLRENRKNHLKTVKLLMKLLPSKTIA